MVKSMENLKLMSGCKGKTKRTCLYNELWSPLSRSGGSASSSDRTRVNVMI